MSVDMTSRTIGAKAAGTGVTSKDGKEANGFDALIAAMSGSVITPADPATVAALPEGTIAPTAEGEAKADASDPAPQDASDGKDGKGDADALALLDALAPPVAPAVATPVTATPVAAQPEGTTQPAKAPTTTVRISAPTVQPTEHQATAAIPVNTPNPSLMTEAQTPATPPKTAPAKLTDPAAKPTAALAQGQIPTNAPAQAEAKAAPKPAPQAVPQPAVDLSAALAPLKPFRSSVTGDKAARAPTAISATTATPARQPTPASAPKPQGDGAPLTAAATLDRKAAPLDPRQDSAPAVPSLSSHQAAPALADAAPGLPQAPDAAAQLGTRSLDLALGNQSLDQLAREIVSVASGDGNARFQLNPEQLGRLQVELRSTAEGASHVRLTAETDAARQILVAHQPRLEQDSRLMNARIETVSVDVGGGQMFGQQQGRSFQEQPKAPAPAAVLTGASTKGDEAEEASARETARYA